MHKIPEADFEEIAEPPTLPTCFSQPSLSSGSVLGEVLQQFVRIRFQGREGREQISQQRLLIPQNQLVEPVGVFSHRRRSVPHPRPIVIGQSEPPGFSADDSFISRGTFHAGRLCAPERISRLNCNPAEDDWQALNWKTAFTINRKERSPAKPQPTCAKRLECVQLAGAIARPMTVQKREQLHALQTLRDIPRRGTCSQVESNFECCSARTGTWERTALTRKVIAPAYPTACESLASPWLSCSVYVDTRGPAIPNSNSPPEQTKGSSQSTPTRGA